MLDFILNLDKELFLFLNRHHNSFFDFWMTLLSEKLGPLPLYIFILGCIVYVFRFKAIWIVLGIIVLIAITDQSAYWFFKAIFQRLRPCHQSDIAPFVHLIDNHCGGKYGFISLHAANAFAFSVFVGKILAQKYSVFSPFLLAFAALVAYSRIYVGVHFPLDVIVGGLYGALWGYLFFILFKRFQLF